MPIRRGPLGLLLRRLFAVVPCLLLFGCTSSPAKASADDRSVLGSGSQTVWAQAEPKLAYKGPAEGCGSQSYWDSASASCKEVAQQEPSRSPEKLAPAVPLAARDDRPNLDPLSRDYFARLRQMIIDHVVHPPCEWEGRWLPHCSFKATRVVVEFSILRNGHLQSTIVRESSEFAVYNEAAIKAVQEAAPFPPIPDAMFVGRPQIVVRVPIEYEAPRRP